MSVDLYFYEMSRIENCPEIIDSDLLDFDSGISWFRVDQSEMPEWAGIVGTRAMVKSSYVNMFKASEEVFGKKACSISCNSFDLDTLRFFFDDGTWLERQRNEFESFREHDEFEAVVYKREVIGRIEHDIPELGLSEMDECRIDFETALNLIERYITTFSEDLEGGFAGEWYLSPLYVFSKVMVMSRDPRRVIVFERY